MSAHKKGFTLVELLVVIAIIAVLSAVGLATFSTAQKAGRMSKRIQDLRAIQTALELYYSVNKAYPSTGGNINWRSECTSFAGVPADDVVQETSTKKLVPQYMPSFPSDPSMVASTNTACYLYTSDGVDYKLLDYNVSEIVDTVDLPANRNFWDPRNSSYPNPCSGNTTVRKLAVWSSVNSRCW